MSLTPERMEQERLNFESVWGGNGLSFEQTSARHWTNYKYIETHEIWAGWLSSAEQKQPFFDSARAQKDELIKSNVALKARISDLEATRLEDVALIKQQTARIRDLQSDSSRLDWLEKLCRDGHRVKLDLQAYESVRGEIDRIRWKV